MKKIALKISMLLLRFSMSKVSISEQFTINEAFSKANTGLVEIARKFFEIKKHKLKRNIVEMYFADPLNMTIELDIGRHFENDIHQQITIGQIPTKKTKPKPNFKPTPFNLLQTKMKKIEEAEDRLNQRFSELESFEKEIKKEHKKLKK